MHPLIIILLTLFGVAVLLWLVFGINWRSKQNYDRKHRRLHARMQAEDTEALQRLLFSNSLTMRVEQRFRPLAMLLAQDGRPSVAVSDVEIITSGKDKYNMLMSDLICAKESIHMEYFHFGIDRYSRRIRQFSLSGQECRECFCVQHILCTVTVDIMGNRCKYAACQKN